MRTINIHSAKTNLSKLIDQVFDGEEVIICKSGCPMAKLVKYIAQSSVRKLSQWKGDVYISPDFDDILSTILAAFNR